MSQIILIGSLVAILVALLVIKLKKMPKQGGCQTSAGSFRPRGLILLAPESAPVARHGPWFVATLGSTATGLVKIVAFGVTTYLPSLVVTTVARA